MDSIIVFAITVALIILFIYALAYYKLIAIGYYYSNANYPNARFPTHCGVQIAPNGIYDTLYPLGAESQIIDGMYYWTELHNMAYVARRNPGTDELYTITAVTKSGERGVVDIINGAYQTLARGEIGLNTAWKRHRTLLIKSR